MKNTFKLFKKILSDLGLLYRNFIHWNISKLFITVASLILGIILSLPFVIILVILYFSFNLGEIIKSLDNLFSLLSFFAESPIVFILVMFFSILAIFGFLFGYNYKKVLFINLNLEYLDGNKIPYLKNKYLDFKLMRKYVAILTYIGLILLIPIVLFCVIYLIMFLFYGGTEGIYTLLHNNTLSSYVILTFLFFILFSIIFIYLSYRTYFSLIIFMDRKEYNIEENALFYVKESFILTKSLKSFFRFISLLLLISFVVFPFGIIPDHFSKQINDSNNYLYYKTFSSEYKNQLKEQGSSYYWNELELKFSDYTDQKLKSFQFVSYILMYFFNFLNFILVYGLLEMMVISFYKHELHKKSLFSSLFDV